MARAYRTAWLALAVVVPLWAQGVDDPILAWLDRSGAAVDVMGLAVSGGAIDARQQAEIARWEWELASRAAEHQRLGTVWLASERYMANPGDQAARQMFFQESMAAGQQHYQQCAEAWQRTYQSLMQGGQSSGQRLQSAWQQSSNELQQSLQRLQQLVQQGELGELPMDELLAAGEPIQATAAEQALRAATAAAGDALTGAVAEAEGAWRDGMIEAAAPDGDLEAIGKAFGRLHREFVRATGDALDAYRDACRKALRDYELSVEEAQDA